MNYLSCWGSNHRKQTSFPKEIAQHNLIVAAGEMHSCAVRIGGNTDHIIVCWGENRYGQTDVPTDLYHLVHINHQGKGKEIEKLDQTGAEKKKEKSKRKREGVENEVGDNSDISRIKLEGDDD